MFLKCTLRANEMKVILASASPRRKELLEQIGIQFEIQVSKADETITTNVPSDVVEELSTIKAMAVLPGNEEALIIGADTVVACEGTILGKPGTPEIAKEMLGKLQGREHQVYTGVTLLYKGKKCTFHEKTDVKFYPMTPEEIAEYVATGDPMDKAGAYGIQGFCARYIERIQGDYNNVVGLPIGRLYQEMKQFIKE